MREVDIHKAFSVAKRERVVLVVTMKPDGKLNVMPVSWNMKCSSNPPMFAVAIQNGQYTPGLIDNTGEYTVAIANAGLTDLVEFSGTTSGEKIDKYNAFPFATTPARYIAPPLITDATINFECRLHQSVSVGDYTVYIGLILAAYQHDKQDKTLITMSKKNNKRMYHEI